MSKEKQCTKCGFYFAEDLVVQGLCEYCATDGQSDTLPVFGPDTPSNQDDGEYVDVPEATQEAEVVHLGDRDWSNEDELLPEFDEWLAEFEPTEQNIFEYLDSLRWAGITNMFGAGIYLEGRFGFDKNEAKSWLVKWMGQFKG